VEAPWLSRLVVVLIVFALFTLAEAQQPKIYRVGVILQGGPFYEQSLCYRVFEARKGGRATSANLIHRAGRCLRRRAQTILCRSDSILLLKLFSSGISTRSAALVSEAPLSAVLAQCFAG
jgi:hypothetical protein